MSFKNYYKRKFLMFNVNKCKQFLFFFQRQMYQFISKLRIRNFKQIVNRILRMCEFVFFLYQGVLSQ